MGRTVAELDASLSIDELYQWVVYSSIEPWGEDRQDWRVANTNWLMATIWGDGKRKHKVTDFLLKFTKKRDTIKPNEGMNVDEWNALILKAMFGGTKKQSRSP